jgi:hypothetical protein
MFYLKENKVLDKVLVAVLVLMMSSRVSAQTEFEKGFIIHARLHSGMITHPEADIFVGGLQVIPQVTIVEHTLRGGVVIGGIYSFKEINGLFGPTLSLKIMEFPASVFGSAGNLHVNADYLWGTEDQRLVGGGINLDLLNKIIEHNCSHDHNLSDWWFQSAIAFKIFNTKQKEGDFPH